jgi:hypothetical protein
MRKQSLDAHGYHGLVEPESPRIRHSTARAKLFDADGIVSCTEPMNLAGGRIRALAGGSTASHRPDGVDNSPYMRSGRLVIHWWPLRRPTRVRTMHESRKHGQECRSQTRPGFRFSRIPRDEASAGR